MTLLPMKSPKNAPKECSDNLRWSKVRPTSQGFYFWRFNSWSETGIVRIIPMTSGLFADGDSLGRDMVDQWPGQWAGPIEEPAE